MFQQKVGSIQFIIRHGFSDAFERNHNQFIKDIADFKEIIEVIPL